LGRILGRFEEIVATGVAPTPPPAPFGLRAYGLGSPVKDFQAWSRVEKWVKWAEAALGAE